MRKTRLFTPGPTPLIPEAQLELARPLLHHRTPEFGELLLETRRSLQLLFHTKAEMVLLSSSGTGAMEAAVSNLHSEGDKVLAVVAGKFGERWAELADTFGLNCIRLNRRWGDAARADEILDCLEKNPDTRSLLIQACETSTGTAHDLESIAGSVREKYPRLLIIVDAISAIGSQPVETDRWGLDVVISGAQKAFGVPPGLSFLSVGPRAVEALASGPQLPHFYFNLGKEVAGQTKGATAYSPAISLVYALRKATQMMLEEGLEKLIESAELMARCTRRGLRELGFQLLSSSPANALTAASPPAGISADALRSALDKRFGVKVAGGQGPLKGKIIRIAHLGYFDLLDVVSILAAIELCFHQMHKAVTLGSSVAAAMEEARSAVTQDS